MVRGVLRRLFARSKSGDEGPTQEGSYFVDTGFHGDAYLLRVVDLVIRDCCAFVETGTNVGSTLAYVARAYPHLQCLSCEPDLHAFQQAIGNTSGLSNVLIYNETSQEFLKRIEEQHSWLFPRNALLWLDAHGYGFEWPLKEEIAFITGHFNAAHILIDDFRVPGLDCFGYSVYQDQECSYEYIRDSLDPRYEYTLYYPSYTDRTSRHHALRGWGLIEFGHNIVPDLPCLLQDKVRVARQVEVG